MDRVEPQSANDYDTRTTAAVRSVLVEIGQILGSFVGRFAVIAGGRLISGRRTLSARSTPGSPDSA